MRRQTIFGREIYDCKMEKPFRLIVGGGSGTGKTTLLRQLVNKSHFSTPFDKIVYCYPDYLDEIPVEFDQIVEYKPGLCDLAYFTALPKNSLIIYDDMMNECGNSDDIMKLFSVIARKRNLSIIFIVQNIYDNSKQFRNIRLNATGFIVFKFFAATDVTKRLFRDLGIQSLMPKRLLDEIYNKRYAYIFIDVHPERHSEFITIRGNIFDQCFSIYHKMEYIAIPKADFVKYFKIAEIKEGTVRALKNEIEIRETKPNRKQSKSRKRRRSTEYATKRRARSQSPITTGTDYTESE